MSLSKCKTLALWQILKAVVKIIHKLRKKKTPESYVWQRISSYNFYIMSSQNATITNNPVKTGKRYEQTLHQRRYKDDTKHLKMSISVGNEN